MLAPNLYTLLRRLARVWKQPFAIYEIGSCFRARHEGRRHLNEFTMLNLVELGTPLGERDERLRELAVVVLDAAGVTGYEFVLKHSEVYGDELDVVVAGLEVCSTALGPHPLDDAWAITDPWVGLGFGLERLLVARDGPGRHRARGAQPELPRRGAAASRGTPGGRGSPHPARPHVPLKRATVPGVVPAR